MGFADDVAIMATSEALLTQENREVLHLVGHARQDLSSRVCNDFGAQKDTDVSNTSYEGQALPHLPAPEGFRNLCLRIALSGSFQRKRHYVHDSVNSLQSLVKGHKVQPRSDGGGHADGRLLALPIFCPVGALVQRLARQAAHEMDLLC